MKNLSVLHDMALFVEVARTGSFSRASLSLGMPGATLSRRIAGMEKQLGVRLFDRSTRRVELTTAGRRYFDRCAALVDEARLAEEALKEVASHADGHLRVSMPVDLGVHVVGPLLPDFARAYPGITFEIDLSPRHADIVGEHVDVAIRIGTVREDQLVVRRVGWVEQALYASPAYLAARSPPQLPAELAAHDCIFVSVQRREPRWHLRHGTDACEVTVRGRFGVNNHGLMQLLAERGMGIAALTPALVQSAVLQGRLVPVLASWSVPRLPIHAVVASHLQSAAVRAFVDFLSQRFSDLPAHTLFERLAPLRG